tara:strand:+ start:4256 stop:5893 length:1638 start_codon:yes stop_codon:yes gene_type:complete
MQTIALDLIKKLKNKGIDTFFGVQGGACARLIEAVIKSGGKFYPVLNEQAAGYCAHGYFLTKKKPAGVIVTTGPGFTNAVSGISACYYDNIPTVVLVGQVKKKLNIAKKFDTKMVGFQELPHLKIGKNFSDKVYCINSEQNYKKFLRESLSEIDKITSIIEILDDVQRIKIKSKQFIKKFKKEEKKKVSNFFKKKMIKYLNEASNPIFLIGAGFARSNKVSTNINLLNKINLPVSSSWGGQEVSRKIKKSIGIFGDHSPGFANEYIKNSNFLICLGVSLLQHQVGSLQKNFAPKAKIIFVNNNINECKRAKKQFGSRLEYYNTDIHSFILSLNKKKITIMNNNFTEVDEEKYLKKQNTPVKILKSIIEKIDPKNSIIFSDAGATLSWTYQASNLIKNCASVFTAFNLHPMGYANCAAIGAAVALKKKIYVIIGDGSIPMNSQELSWAKKFDIKFIVIDNKGYAVIRQTQKQFYKSLFLGSDFKNKKSSLPYFSIQKIFKSFDIITKLANSKFLKLNQIKSFIQNKKSVALIINIKYSEIINTNKY